MKHYLEETLENLNVSGIHNGYDRNVLRDMIRAKFFESLAIEALTYYFPAETIYQAEIHEQRAGIADYLITPQNLPIEWKLWQNYEYFPIELSINYKCEGTKEDFLKELKGESVLGKYKGWIYSYSKDTTFLFTHLYWKEHFFIKRKDLVQYLIDNYSNLRTHSTKSSGGIVIMLKRHNINNIPRKVLPIKDNTIQDRYQKWIKTESYAKLYEMKLKQTNFFKNGLEYL